MGHAAVIVGLLAENMFPFAHLVSNYSRSFTLHSVLMPQWLPGAATHYVPYNVFIF